MPRNATEAQLRAFLEYPPKGDDEDFRAYVKSLIGKDYFGGDLPTEDFRIVWDEHNKDVYAKQDALAKRREAAVAEAKANKEAGIATFKAIAEHLADPNWRNMDQIAKALGLNDIASAFGQLQNYGIDPIKLGVDGRYVQPGAGVRYGLWAETLDELVADIGKATAEYQKMQDDEFDIALIKAEKARDEGRAYLKEQARLKDDELYQERLKTQELNEQLRKEKLAEERHQISIDRAKKGLAQSQCALKIAREQLASLASPEARSAFRKAQQDRHNPGGGGYTYDRRGRAPTEEEAFLVIERLLEHVDGWSSRLKEYQSGEPNYRMHDRSADILLAADNYPAEDNPYYWNKRGQPKLGKLRAWTKIQATKRERDSIWPMEDIVEEEE